MDDLFQRMVSCVLPSWRAFIDEEVKKPYFQALLEKLKALKATIIPKPELIFRVFSFFKPIDTKVIIFGQDPYPSPNDACGLAFASNNSKTPASLKRIILRLEKEYPSLKQESSWQQNFLLNWAEQGVLLLNGILTTTVFIRNAHKNWGWEEFNCNLLTFLKNQNIKPLLVFLGVQTKNFVVKSIGNVDGFEHLSYPHPSPLSGNLFLTNPNDLFKTINNWLKQHNQKIINWAAVKNASFDQLS
ncbi:uracil-DNA glycosylase [Mycoplasmoides genitalium]